MMQYGKELMEIKNWKMRYFLGLILYMATITCLNAQTGIQFRCYLKSGCNKNLSELKEYSLRKDSFFYSSLNNGTVANLPDTGFYVLESSSIATEGDKIYVHIIYGLNVDTIKKKDINDVVFLDSRPLEGMSQGGGWICCGKPCEGYKVDYYNNGRKRIEGSFRNGKPMGKLKFYFDSGKLKYVEYFNKSGRKVKSRHLKNLSKTGFSSQNKSELVTWYRSLLDSNIFLSDGVYVRKTSTSVQHPLFQWLTQVGKNGNFDSDVQRPFDKFIINKHGELVAVLGSYISFSSVSLNRVLAVQ